MPLKDGTGPPGGGRGRRGGGGGRGQGMGAGRGRGGGRMGGNRPGAGPAGNCLCPNCGKKTPHQAGIPCYTQNCPECGTQMIRE
jgi:hypothetical protein